MMSSAPIIIYSYTIILSYSHTQRRQPHTPILCSVSCLNTQDDGYEGGDIGHVKGFVAVDVGIVGIEG